MARNLKNICRLIDSINNEIPPEKDFLEDLKRSIELNASKDVRLPSKTFKPSGMNCMRANYYQLIGVEPDADDVSYQRIGICASGSDTHLRVQTEVSRMKENGIDCEWIDVGDYVTSRKLEDIEVVTQSGMETKLYNKRYNISFMCDGIIRYKGKYYILELKTESSHKFFDRKAVDISHYNQATAYTLSLAISDVIFVYINRDVLDMKSYMFSVSDDARNRLVNYIETCTEYVNNNIVPPKDENVSRKTCSYCCYKSQCQKEVS